LTRQPVALIITAMQTRRTGWIAPIILGALSLLIWGLLLLAGLTGISSIRQQRVAGYPNAEQISYYVGVPTVICIVAVAGLIWRLRAPNVVVRFRWVGTLVLTLSLIALLPFLFLYGGGM
jgi:hypothetical protein